MLFFNMFVCNWWTNMSKLSYSVLQRPSALHLNMSPGTSLNWTLISAFLEFNAFPAFSMNGTPAKDGVGNENKERGNIAYKFKKKFQGTIPSHLSLCIRRTTVEKVGVFEWSGTVGSSVYPSYCPRTTSSSLIGSTDWRTYILIY